MNGINGQDQKFGALIMQSKWNHSVAKLPIYSMLNEGESSDFYFLATRDHIYLIEMASTSDVTTQRIIDQLQFLD